MDLFETMKEISISHVIFTEYLTVAKGAFRTFEELRIRNFDRLIGTKLIDQGDEGADVNFMRRDLNQDGGTKKKSEKPI